MAASANLSIREFEERRSVGRRRTGIRARCIGGQAAATDVKIHNASVNGFSFSSEHIFSPGSHLILDVQGKFCKIFQIIWQKDGKYGAFFSETLSYSELSYLTLTYQDNDMGLVNSQAVNKRKENLSLDDDLKMKNLDFLSDRKLPPGVSLLIIMGMSCFFWWIIAKIFLSFLIFIQIV